MEKQHPAKFEQPPLVSVILVALNAETVLEKTLQSIVTQPYREIELTVVDGGSTDGTPAILAKYRHYIDNLILGPDRGVYDAMNKGVAMAKGAWIYFIGAGDILRPVLDQVAACLKNPKAIYYGDVFHLTAGRVYDGKFSPFKLAVSNICHQAIFYPQSVFKFYSFNTDYRLLADHELNMRCFGDAGLKFIYLPIVICDYQGGGLSEQGHDLRFYKDKLRIVRKNFPFIVYAYAWVRNRVGKLLLKKNYGLD
jgi:glycosyltransferase involved in cell wall biosynthesis